jgi:hypothetical protein
MKLPALRLIDQERSTETAAYAYKIYKLSARRAEIHPFEDQIPRQTAGIGLLDSKKGRSR